MLASLSQLYLGRDMEGGQVHRAPRRLSHYCTSQLKKPNKWQNSITVARVLLKYRREVEVKLSYTSSLKNLYILVIYNIKPARFVNRDQSEVDLFMWAFGRRHNVAVGANVGRSLDSSHGHKYFSPMHHFRLPLSSTLILK